MTVHTPAASRRRGLPASAGQPVRTVPQPWQRPTPPDFHHAFESPEDAEALDLGRFLSLVYDGSPAALDLARAMRPDVTAQRLRYTPAGARPMRTARTRIIEAALPPFREQLEWEGELWFVTALLTGGYQPLGRLHLMNPGLLRGRIRTRVNRAVARCPELAGGLILGMAETSVRLNDAGTPTGHQLHFHAVCDGRGLAALNTLPRRRFGAGPERVHQPVLALPIATPETLARRLGYVLKAQVRTWDPHRKIGKATGQAGPVMPYELPPDLQPEALLWMNQWRLSEMILVMGMYSLRSAMEMVW